MGERGKLGGTSLTIGLLKNKVAAQTTATNVLYLTKLAVSLSRCYL